MKMKHLVAIAELFRVARRDSSMSIQFSTRPWRPDTQWNEDMPFQIEKGIYVFCGEGDDLPAAESSAEVWYVGKANSAKDRPISARVFDNFGPIIYDPVTNERLGHSRHCLNETNGIPQDYKTAIELRRCAVYTAAVSGKSEDIPEDLEKFILNAFYLFHQITDGVGQLPPLNTMRP